MSAADLAFEDGRVTWTLPPDLETPALVVDLDTLDANLDRMADGLAQRGVGLRPHAKTHKSPAIADRQRARGATGLTVATIGEAELFADHGHDDLFIAYPLWVTGTKAERLRALCGRATVAVGVDSAESADHLAAAVRGAPIRAVVEVDSGQHRSGVRPEAALAVAIAARRAGLDVAGVFTHGGHSYRPGSAESAAADEREALGAAAAALEAEGFEVRVVSAGSTPSALASAGGRVSEERPGTYVFNDRQQVALGQANDDQLALAVAATVVSTSVPGQAVLDAGSKSLASDRPDWLDAHGAVPELGWAPVVSLSEHHGLVDLGDRPAPPLGSVLRVVPNHVCTVVNLFDRYVVAQDGKVVDHWPVAARGHLS